jgi:hypothetical protein
MSIIHIFYIYFTIKQILEVNENQTKILNISESFNLTREALKGKQKQLKQQNKGNKPKRERSGQSHNTIFTI